MNANTYFVSSDHSLLQPELIHSFLSSSYWAKNIPLETVLRSIENSICFGVYNGKEQVGFARVVTDKSVFAYLADVFILPEHRGKGLSNILMKEIMSHPDLQGLRRWILGTRDAHGLYKKFGFTPLALPDRWMEVHDPDIYKSKIE